MLMRSLGFAFLLVLSAACKSGGPSNAAQTEFDIQYVTSDVERFWRTWDGAERLSDRAERVALWEAEYFKPASPGLREFFRLKIRDVDVFVETLESYPEFYRSLRANMGRASKSPKALEIALRRLREYLPEAQFPPVTLVVGCMTSGGTKSDCGLMIGLEMLSAAPDTPTDSLPLGMRRGARSSAHLVPTIVHELAHTLQDQTQGGRSLLMASLMEGGAEYISFLACGARDPETFYMRWGREHEAQVWAEFQEAMHGDDTSRWIANNSRASEEWPADLGYFVGFQIARAFHEGATVPGDALRELLSVRDPVSVLKRSGYDGVRAN